MADFKNANECEKQRLVEDEAVSQPLIPRPLTFRERLFRHVIPSVLLLLSVSILFRKVFVCHHRYDSGKYLQSYDEPAYKEEWAVPANKTARVALEAHVMSKCPDATYCMNELVVPAMAQIDNEKVDFTLSFIGKLKHGTDEVQCMHGPGECLGNIIELCVAKHYPHPVIYLGFANCMFSNYKKIPQQHLVQSCALEHGVDFHQVNACISGENEGIQLLRESVKHSQEVGVSTSCTIRLENKVFCVRDGGKWKDCPGGSSVSSLVSHIEDVYQKKNAD